jgi:hypothetical protein
MGDRLRTRVPRSLFRRFFYALDASAGVAEMTMRVADVAPNDMVRKIAKPGGYIEVSLADALEQLEEYFDSRADVEDGDYGAPRANREMQLYGLVKDLQEAFCDGESQG